MEQDDGDEQGTWDVDDEFGQELEELAAQADGGHARSHEEVWRELFASREESSTLIGQEKISS